MTKPSEVKYSITISACATCSVDALLLIRDNEEMFHSFLKTDNVFQRALFNVLQQVYELDT